MFRSAGKYVLRRWHAILNLPRQTPLSWHLDRYNEELIELSEAKTVVEKISEEADVVFAISRAEFDGFPIAEFPQFRKRHLLVYPYMIGKYTSRWLFYRVLAFLCGAPRHTVREVVNASKDCKLEVVARRHSIDELKFTTVGRRLRRVWPLFP